MEQIQVLTSATMANIHELLFLFVISFLAATVLPAQSESALAGLTLAGQSHVAVLVCVATLGNVLGSVVNWFFGKYIIRFEHKRWFPIKEKKLAKATRFYEKWGAWTLLLAWLPIIGDPLTLVAGIFKTNLWFFLTLVTIGKLARYIAIVWWL